MTSKAVSTSRMHGEKKAKRQRRGATNARALLTLSTGAAALSLLGVRGAFAATYTWTGAATGGTASNFQNPSNWSSSPAFAAFNDYVFNGAVNTAVSLGSNAAPPTAATSPFNSLTFNAGSGPFTFSTNATGEQFSFNGATAGNVVTNNVTIGSGVTSDITFGNSTNPIFGAGAVNAGTENVTFTNNSSTNSLIVNGNMYAYQGGGAGPVTNFTFAGSGNSTLGANSSIVLGSGGGGIVGTVNLIKTGSGTLNVLSSSNAYNGSTTVSGGILAINASVGLPLNSNLNISNGTVSLLYNGFNAIKYTNAGTVTINSGGTLSADASSGANESDLFNVVLNGGTLGQTTGTNSGGGLTNFQIIGSVHATANSTITASLAKFSTSAGAQIPFLVDSGVNLTDSGVMTASYFSATGFGIAKTGAGTLSLAAANNYVGITTIDAGTINSTSFANVNTASGIGKGSSAGSAADLVFGGGTLQYNTDTASASTNRLFTLGDANGLTATLDSSAATSTHTLSFTGTGAIALGGSGGRVLTLTGSNTGANGFAPILGDGSGGTTSLNKTGAGTWVLSGANTYTGSTSISSGVLALLSSGSLSSSNTSVNGTVQTTISNAVGAFDGSTNGSGTSPIPGSVLYVDENANSTSSTTPTNHFGAGTVTLNGGTLYFRLNGNPTTVSNVSLTAGGLIGIGPANFGVSNRKATLTTFVSQATSTASFASFYQPLGTNDQILIANLNGAAVTTGSNVNNIIGGWATAFNSQGGASTVTDFASFSTTVAGSVVQMGQSGAPPYTSTSTLGGQPSTANVSEGSAGETLNTAQAINALAYNGSGAVTINSPGSLTLTSGGLILGGASKTLSGTGTLTAGAGSATAAAPTAYNLYATVNDSNAYAIATPIADNATNTVSFNKGGVGALSLTAANSYSGGTTVNGGTLRINNSSGSGVGTGSVTVNSGAILGGNGVIGATATANGAITVAAAARIAAGPDAATTGILTSLSTSGVTFNGGSGYTWKINNGAGVAGSGFDQVATQGITFAGLSSAKPFSVFITGAPTGLSGGTTTYIIATDPTGPIAINSIGAQPNNTFLTGASAATADAGLFALDTSGFSAANSPVVGSSSLFQLQLLADGSSGQDLALVYTAAPEPGTACLGLAAAFPLLLTRRGRRQA